MLDPNKEVVAGAAVVRLKPGIRKKVLSVLVRPATCTVCQVFTSAPGIKRSGRERTYHLELDVPVDPYELVEMLRARDEVEKADPIYLKQPCRVPEKARRYSSQWGLRSINCEKAWDVTTGSRTVRVAVVDSGVQADHPDLKPNTIAGKTTIPAVLPKLAPGYRWVGSYGPGTPALDAHGHGTHVAGIIGACGRREIVGVNWRCSIVPLRVFAIWEEISTKRRGVTSTDGWVADALDWAVSEGARVINLSLGGYGGMSFELEEALDDALAAGVIICAAAGNDHTRRRHYPSAKKGVWGIGAHDRRGMKASFSNFGKANVMFVAPGVEILSTLPNDGYGVLSGTSMACPHVAGLAGLMLAGKPSLTSEEVRQRLMEAVRGGRLDAAKALGPRKRPKTPKNDASVRSRTRRVLSSQGRGATNPRI